MKRKGYLRLALALGMSAVGLGGSAEAATVNATNTLYYYGVNAGDSVVVTTTATGGTSPLGGFGVYMASGGATKYDLDSVTITTTGSAADAIRTNSGAVTFIANSLTIDASGSSADGINIASDFDQNYDTGAYIKDSAYIRVKSGNAVRANAHRNAGAKSVIVLPDNSYIEVYGTSNATNASDSTGYAVYAGNRDRDTNGLGIMDILQGKNNNTLGNSYVFIGENATIKTSTGSGHAVYANKGGFIQLGDGVDISTTGVNALTIYASTEQQGTYTDNVRPGTVYLSGGATLRATNSGNVIQAQGIDSIITSKKIDTPNTPVQAWDRVTIADKSTAVETRGVFDIEGNIDAIAGGMIDLNFADESLFVGSTSVDTSSTVNLDITGENSKWIMTKDSTMTNLTLTSGATVYLSDETDLATRQTLTINGDYHGDEGKFVFNGVLAGDSSPIDFVNIAGDVSGTTKVAVNNLGGLGEKTINGIEIIRIAGDSPNGSFIQDGRIVAGAYDYFVTKGDEQGNNTNNWYLTNTILTEPPTPPTSPEPSIRPEGGAYLGNAYAANNLFQLTLHDRIGEVALLDVASLQDKSKNIWARVDKRKVSMKEKSDQIDLKQDYDAVQVGFDLIRKKENNRMYLLGIMGGYGNAKTNAKGQLWDAKGTIDGYSLGLYGTIYDEHKDQSGKYVDAWILWNDFDGKVKGDGLASEKYGLNGITASIEAGYDQLAMRHETNPNHNLWLKWQAQVTYQGVKSDRHQEVNGTIVGKNDDNIQTRLGVRLYKKIMGESGKWHQPYAEINWHHNTSTYDISMDSDRDFSTYGMRNVFELKLGYEGQISKNMQLWGNIFGGLGTQGNYTYGARVGLKYSF